MCIYIYIYLPILTRLKLTKNEDIYSLNEHETWAVIYSILPINTWFWGIPRIFEPWSQTVATKTYMAMGPWTWSNPPSWTISTLMAWYAIFPCILARMQTLSDNNISYGIVRMFWISLGVVFLVGFKCYWPVQQVHDHKMIND